MEAKDRAKLNRWLRDEHVPSVAFHEAGHAVVMALTGAGVECVFLKPADEEGESLGLVEGQATPARIFVTDEHQDAMIAAGGLVAESILLGQTAGDCIARLEARFEDDTEEDFSDLCDERSLLRARESGVDIQRAIRETWDLLTKHRASVEALATGLVSRWAEDGRQPYLSSAEVEEAMKTGRPPR